MRIFGHAERPRWQAVTPPGHRSVSLLGAFLPGEPGVALRLCLRNIGSVSGAACSSLGLAGVPAAGG